jgi:photosystem II cytochrome c550
MVRKLISLVAAVLLTFSLLVGSAAASKYSDPATRTVPLNTEGDTVELSILQVNNGKLMFGQSCAECHAGGKTKTEPNVGLGPKALASAIPNRNNIEGLIDYMKNPTTYDGTIDIFEIHPSLRSSDIFTQMRILSDDDLYDIAGYILVQPKIAGSTWDN